MLLYETFDIKIVQSWIGCVIAASVISFPLMYRNAKAAFESIDADLVYAGRTLGMSRRQNFLENCASNSLTNLALQREQF